MYTLTWRMHPHKALCHNLARQRTSRKWTGYIASFPGFARPKVSTFGIDPSPSLSVLVCSRFWSGNHQPAYQPSVARIRPFSLFNLFPAIAPPDLQEITVSYTCLCPGFGCLFPTRLSLVLASQPTRLVKPNA